MQPWLLHYVHKKVRWGHELASYSTKTLNFTQVLHFSWLTKSEMSGSRPLVVNIKGNYCCTIVLLCPKMLKETEKTIGFFVTFLSLVLFQLVEAPPWLRLWAQSWRSLVFFSWNVFLLTVGGQAVFGGEIDPYCPPWRRACSKRFTIAFTSD